MTKEQINSVLERVRSWPRQRQEDAACLLLAIEAQDTEVYVLSDEERADLSAALEEGERGEIADQTEVAAIFDRHRAWQSATAVVRLQS